MKRSEWSDKQLEDLIRQMPKMQDHRHPHDIYQNLSLKVKKRRQKTWIMPGLAAAAALILLFILSPGLLDNRESVETSHKGADISGKKIAGSQEQSRTMLKKEGKAGSGLSIAANKESITPTTALYEEDAKKGKVLTYWIPDAQAQILVPVSIIVDQNGSLTWLDQLNQHMQDLNDSQWGLSDYYPLNATLHLDPSGSSVVVDVPANHQYGIGSTGQTSFVHVIQSNVRSNSDIKKIQFTTDNNPGILLDNLGEVKETKVEPESKKAYLFLLPEGKDIPFLVPTIESYSDIKAALLAMQNDIPTESLKASLPGSLKIEDAALKDGTLLITLSEGTVLSDDAATLHSFEAIMLTAKEFGADNVKFENPPIPKLGPFDLTIANKVPVGPNYQRIDSAN